jgi:hypothetical protein
MTTQYVIRAFQFTYYDEYYHYDGDWAAIEAVFDDAAIAQAELERLTVKEMRRSLVMYPPFWEASDDFVKRANALCVERCGNPLFHENSPSSGHQAEYIPEGMSDADVLELAQLANLQIFHVFEVPADGGFLALWLPEQKHYIGTYTGTTPLDIVYQLSIDAFMEDYIPYQISFVFPKSWNGTYEDLSNTPMLLRQFVSSQQHMAYDDATQTLSFTAPDSNPVSYVSIPDLFALNALLKKPVFEIRKLTVQELQAMKA